MNTNDLKNQKNVIVFGAGIAGLTVAHEFSKKGYNVKVYEVNAESGGFFRSSRKEENHQSPSEYSWHGIGPFYHNVFALFQEIPYDNEQNLYDAILSRPIDFGLASTNGKIRFDEPKTEPINVKKMFDFTAKDYFLWLWVILRVWCSNKRSQMYYSTINAKEAWFPLLSPIGIKNWSACFGPWIGSDYNNVSLHQAGNFFLKQLTTKERYVHKADDEGPSWIHTARSGWLLLNGPSNEVFFDKWIKYLENQNVEFFWNKELNELKYDGSSITSSSLKSGEELNADIYILAINPFATSQIINKTPALLIDQQLSLFPSLIKDGPHTQVSFRIAFKDKIFWNRKRCGLIIVDSEYNLTLFAQEQAWTEKIFLGDNVKSLWTITACVSKNPGPVYGLPLEKCTKQQFIDEVLFQLYKCESLNEMVMSANYGKELKDFKIDHIEVWHEWLFSPTGIKPLQPKWVNSTHTQKYMPTQKTNIHNLALAGAHTQTSVDVWSIEAAVESGKRAVQIFEPDINFKTQYKPYFLKILGRIDDVLFSVNLPNIIDITLATIIAYLIFILSFMIFY